MEPISLTSAATAIATIFFTKTIEKPGEDLGEFLSDKAKALIGKLSSRSTKVKNFLEAGSQQPLDIGEAILEIKALAEREPDTAKAILELEAAAKDEPNAQFQSEIERVKQEAVNLEGQQPTIQNMSKLADKIASVNQGYINTQNITNNF